MTADKPTKPADGLVLLADENKPAGLMLAEALNAPSLRAAATLVAMDRKGPFNHGDTPPPSINEQMQALHARAEKIDDGNMRLPEHTLMAQMQVLDGMFNLLTQRALHNLDHSLEATERYMKMALRAQNQCRATIEALAEVKNPRVAVFASQANVSSGPQQVNNGTPSPAPARGDFAPQNWGANKVPSPAPARGDSAGCVNMTNELLEHQHGKGLDTGAPGQAGRAHQTVEAVGEKHRATHRSRQGNQ